MDSPTLRILDASLNRATEGLRVVEDYARFVLGDRFLSLLAKDLRHDLTQESSTIPGFIHRNTVRDTQGDVGTKISTPDESNRADAWSVCVASLKRVEQSLRSLEEYGKLTSIEFAAACEQLRYRTYTLEKSLDTARTSTTRLTDCRVCVLIEGQDSAESFESLVGQLIAAGVGMLQLRDKRLDDSDLLGRARQLVGLSRDADTLAIVNDRVDIAAAAHADGVHLGQDDLPVAAARAIVGPKALIGMSTHSLKQARQAVLDGANYLGAGPTFPSQTKSFLEFPGVDYLRQVAEETSLPTFAIGGIDPSNVGQVAESGIRRVAVASCVTSSDNPENVVRTLTDAFKTTINR